MTKVQRTRRYATRGRSMLEIATAGAPVLKHQMSHVKPRPYVDHRRQPEPSEDDGARDKPGGQAS